MSAPDPQLPESEAQLDPASAPSDPHPSPYSPKLVLALLSLWVGTSGLLYWISKSAWWLCALGGLGAVLVIWPGPKTK
jgi:hypothetical protein